MKRPPGEGVKLRLTRRAPSQADPLVAFVAHLRHLDYSAATCRGYHSDLRLFLAWLSELRGEATGPQHVVAEDVAAYRQHLTARPARPATVKRKVEAIRKLCVWAFHEKLLAEDVAGAIRPVYLSPPQAPRGLASAEVQLLLREAGRRPLRLRRRNYAVVQLFLQTGLRVGEVARLCRDDLKLSTRTGTVRVRWAKGRREREVPLNASVRRALADYLETRGELQSQGPLFVSQRNSPMAVRSLQHLVVELARRARITRLQVTPHVLRHTFAHDWRQRNPDKLNELGVLLGHESPDSTRLYTRPSKEELAEDLERMPHNVPD